jgi:hypothetical protein
VTEDLQTGTWWSRIFKPWMATDEIRCIERHLRASHVMFESGAGGSTYRFSRLVKKYVSVEHNRQWYDRVREANKYSPGLDLRLIEPDARTSNDAVAFRTYIEAACRLATELGVKWDRALVDGSARVLVAMALVPALAEDSLVFVHDWCRPSYQAMLSHYELVEVTRTKMKLAVLKPRRAA